MKTIAAAIRTFRYRKRSLSDQGLISLRAGTHYLSETINITAEDSNLVILGDGHENTFISGGRNYTFEWKTYKKGMGIMMKDTDIMNQALDKAEKENAQVRFMGRKNSAEECQMACEKDATCFAFTWYDDSFGDLSKMCCFRPVGLWTPTHYVKGAASVEK